MSTVSQTAGRNPQGRPRFPLGVTFAVGMGVVAAILALALGPAVPAIFEMAGQARPHAPDLSVWTALSTPIKVHLATALAALALGGVLMAVRKGRTFHRVAGWAWVALVSTTAGVTLFITSLNHGRWSLLHLFTAWTLLVLPLAVVAARRRAVRNHRRAMMGLFYGGFALNLFFAFIPGRALWTMFLG